jgi:hypothetical protein
MKRLLPLIALLLICTAAEAQLFKKKERSVEPQYSAGTIPVANGKVTFEEKIQAEGLTAAQVEERISNWIAARFVEPTIISVKKFDSDQPATTVIKGEEYIVFKDKFFVLSRARIYYYLTLTASDGQCTFNMSRITYWYDDEEEKGGLKMKAEEWITDEYAFNKKGGLKKFEGKFRRKTIELKDLLIEDLKKNLTGNK